MLTFLFIVLMLGVFGKLLVFAIKATWSITKIIVNIAISHYWIICEWSGICSADRTCNCRNCFTDQRSHVKTDQRSRVKNQLTNATLAFMMKKDIKR